VIVKATSPALLPLLRSQTQSELLALLFLNPDREYSLTEVARHTGASLPSVHTEVTRLVGAGLVRDRRVGNVRLIAADLSSALAEPLTQLLAVGYGPRPVLAEALAGVQGIHAAFLHGPWAARQGSWSGPVPDGVDLLVIGTAAGEELSAACARAGRRLEREVHLRQVSVDEWSHATDERPTDPALAELAGGPLVRLIGSDASPVTREADGAEEEPHAPRCRLLALAPVIAATVARVESALPLPGPVTAAVGTIGSVAGLSWLPWDSLPLRWCPSLPRLGRPAR
jgi:hypothetical protein